MTFKSADDAFDAAIKSGRLTTNRQAPNYAGNYMYMGTAGGHDLFKSAVTREYLADTQKGKI